MTDWGVRCRREFVSAKIVHRAPQLSEITLTNYHKRGIDRPEVKFGEESILVEAGGWPASSVRADMTTKLNARSAKLVQTEVKGPK